MEHYKLENDISIFYVTATSFPAGVLAAHQKLHTLVPFTPDRKYLGLSRPEHGVIQYIAATEEAFAGEGEKLGCPTMVVPKGTYVSVILHDYMKDTTAIGIAFQQLLHQPGIDPNGYCVEWYISSTEVRCMVRLADQ